MSQVQKMSWYQGDIAAAISMSKSKGAIFVVYIEGKDEKSTQIAQLINTEEVASKLGGEHFVAIKIEADTIPHQQFSQIYKQTPVPSMYFIGKQGVPLEIITEAKDASSFASNLDGILVKAGLAPSKSSPQQQQSNDLIRQEQHQEEAAAAPATTPSTSFSPPPAATATTLPATPSNVVCEGGVCTLKKKTEDSDQKSPTSSADDGQKNNEEKVADELSQTTTQVVTNTAETEENAHGQPEMTPEEKVERAKQLVEQKRLQKQKEEEEKERQKELERRRMGQNVQQLKRWQEDQELRQVLEERERERKEKQKARERVLAQIEQDKAERAARFSNQPSQPGTPHPQSTAAPQPSPRPAAFNSHTARLQFKMPDGSFSTRDFPSTDTLDSVHRYIREHLNLTFPHYTLSTTFPRREFTDTDRLLSLAQLELVPSAVILILPLSRGGTVSTNSAGGGQRLTAMFWSLLTPLFSLLGYLKTFVFGGAPSAAAAGATGGGTGGGQQQASGSAGGTTTGESSTNKRAGGPSNDQFRFQAKRRSGSESSTVIRRQGNIARLSNRNTTDSDDENNTWNGNSTQQM